jgi:hypothetical protein
MGAVRAPAIPGLVAGVEARALAVVRAPQALRGRQGRPELWRAVKPDAQALVEVQAQGLAEQAA